MKYDAFQDEGGMWRWRLTDDDGQIIFESSGAYFNKEDCLRAIDLNQQYMTIEGAVRNTASPDKQSPRPKAKRENSLSVFLCHSSGDKPAVRDLYNRLRSAANYISPWLDEEDLLPGQRWEDEIPRAVRDSDVVIVCLSRSSVNKTGYVQKEIKYALDVADEQPEGAIFLIPAKLEACELPERLKHLHCVDLHEARGFDKLMRALKSRAEELGLHLENPAGASALPATDSAGGVTGGVLTIDATSLLPGGDGVWEESAKESRSVKSFLDSLWSRLSRHVPAHTYGETWVLRNGKTKQVYWALTFDLEAYHGLGREALTLREAGIEPGMTLEVVPLSGSKDKAG